MNVVANIVKLHLTIFLINAVWIFPLDENKTAAIATTLEV